MLRVQDWAKQTAHFEPPLALAFSGSSGSATPKSE
jgi:hypothetical protein